MGGENTGISIYISCVCLSALKIFGCHPLYSFYKVTWQAKEFDVVLYEMYLIDFKVSGSIVKQHCKLSVWTRSELNWSSSVMERMESSIFSGLFLVLSCLQHVTTSPMDGTQVWTSASQEESFKWDRQAYRFLICISLEGVFIPGFHLGSYSPWHTKDDGVSPGWTRAVINTTFCSAPGRRFTVGENKKTKQVLKLEPIISLPIKQPATHQLDSLLCNGWSKPILVSIFHLLSVN